MAFFVVRPVRTFLRSKRRLVPYDLRIAGERKIPICGYLAHGEKSLSLQRTKGYSIMHRLGKYTASDRMSDLVCGNYHILLIMSRFGIALGFGDRTVDEVCCQSGVDTATFLAVVNLLYDEGTTTVDCRNVSLEAFFALSAQFARLFPAIPSAGHPPQTERGCRLRPRRDCGGDHPVLRRSPVSSLLASLLLALPSHGSKNCSPAKNNSWNCSNPRNHFPPFPQMGTLYFQGPCESHS